MSEIIVTVNGSEVNTVGLTIQNIITRTPDTCNFILQAPDSVPTAGQEVIVYRDTTDNKLFGGVIINAKQTKLSPSEDIYYRDYAYSVECIDYQRQLDRFLVNQTYASSSCKTIIDDIVANFTDSALGFTTNNVETGPTVTKANFSYQRVSDALSKLADLVGYDWYVDADKDIHFFQRKTILAPYNIQDDLAVAGVVPTEPVGKLATDVLAGIGGNVVFDFDLTPDYMQVRNRVIVRGGYELSDAYTETFVTDGQKRIWKLGWKPHNVSAFTVGGAAKTYAVDNLNPDDGTFEYFWNYQESYIRAAENPGTTTTPPDGTIISITYQYEVPILVQVDDTASQLLIAVTEGGSGRYEHVIKDETISSKSEAQDRGQADLDAFANPMITGSFKTYDHGFQAGQVVNVNVSGYTQYAGDYVIQQVSISVPAPGELLYTITFATTLYELKDLLLKLVRGSKRIVLRDDETIDILKIVNETMIISESHVTALKGHPTKWGQFTWDKATWG
jgi:hypothetical protein